jgi:hypothetical protein
VMPFMAVGGWERGRDVLRKKDLAAVRTITVVWTTMEIGRWSDVRTCVLVDIFQFFRMTCVRTYVVLGTKVLVSFNIIFLGSGRERARPLPFCVVAH